MSKPDAYERERSMVERGAALPETAAGLTSGDFSSGRLRSLAEWDEGGPGSEVETAPSWVGDGWGVIAGTSAEWDACEAACRPFKAGFLAGIRGEPRRSEDPAYLAGYEAANG